MTRVLWITPQVVEQSAEEIWDENLAATLAASPPKPTGVTSPMSLLTRRFPGYPVAGRGLRVTV